MGGVGVVIFHFGFGVRVRVRVCWGEGGKVRYFFISFQDGRAAKLVRESNRGESHPTSGPGGWERAILSAYKSQNFNLQGTN